MVATPLVCLIDNKGLLIKRYKGACGSGPEHTTDLYHLAADGNGFCLVVEHGIVNRVVMLNNKLELVKELIPTSMRLEYPLSLCLDKRRKRLYVADHSNGCVFAFNMLP